MKTTSAALLFLNAFLLFTGITMHNSAHGQEVGRKAAAKYFQTQEPPQSTSKKSEPYSSGENFMALTAGSFVQGDAYEWGEKGKTQKTGKSSFGVSYLLSEGVNFDSWFRAEYNSYEVVGEKPTKLSLMPLWTFPRVVSKFPIYFGAGIGLGVFFKQLEDKSNLSLDYQVLAGVRWVNAIEGVGFFFETGLKNHLHVLTEGQFNGTFWQLGVLFNF